MEAWNVAVTLAKKLRGVAELYKVNGDLKERYVYALQKSEHELELLNRYGEPSRTIDHRVWCKTHKCWRIECPK